MRQPYFRNDRNAWYGVISGRRTKLSEDRAIAFAKWKELQVPTNEMAVSAAVQKFLDRPRKQSTQTFYNHHLQLFLNEVPSLRVCGLRAHHLSGLLDKHSGNYAHNIARCVKMCFRWLSDNEYIARNPFATIKTPPAIARGDEAYIAPEAWAKIIAEVKGDLLDILTVLKETGCRPQEARRFEARHLHGQCCILNKKESKGGKVQRVVHLSDDAHGILRRRALKYPSGPLLRNGDWAWSAQVLANRCARLGFSPYQIRHSWCTDAIVRGIDLQTLAVLMGHASLSMLSKVYAHVQKCDKHLQEAVQRATA